jgi:hypothetical protein
MTNKIISIKPKHWYYTYDYPFPNVSPFFNNKNSKKTWIERIKYYYFPKDSKLVSKINNYLTTNNNLYDNRTLEINWQWYYFIQ